MEAISSDCLCRLDDIADPGTLVVRQGGRSIVLYRLGARVKAFANACPHTGARLDALDPGLIDDDTGHLVCSVHGALFDAAGHCVSGPCRGRSLTSVPVDVSGGVVRLAT